MGTRSLTVLQDDDGTEIAVMYRQMDGYPSGHGKELAEFLANKRMVNGFGVGDDGNAFNGGSCLAASVVAQFKDGIGNFYLYPAGTRDAGEEYVYTVRPQDGAVWIRIEEVPYKGTPKLLADGPATGMAAELAGMES